MLTARLAHVALGAGKPDEMLRFYEELFGVVEVERRDDVAYLSGGTSDSFDVALGPWDPGMDHFAFSVAGPDSLDEARRRLLEAELEWEDLPVDAEPGLAAGVRFVVPSGHVMELILEADPEIYRPTPAVAARHHQGAGPVPLEHVTLSCGDVEKTARFLMDTLDVRLTESVQPSGAPWFNAFLRSHHRHHDIAFFADPEGDVPGLNHFCFAVPSVEHLVRVADLAFAVGITLDASPGRHLNGNNVFIYLKDPSGNRVEVNTDMAEVNPAAPARVMEAMRFDVWRESIPPQVLTSSACRDGRTPAATTTR